MSKGDTYRDVDRAKFDANYDNIFRSKRPNADETPEQKYATLSIYIACERCGREFLTDGYRFCPACLKAVDKAVNSPDIGETGGETGGTDENPKDICDWCVD